MDTLKTLHTKQPAPSHVRSIAPSVVRHYFGNARRTRGMCGTRYLDREVHAIALAGNGKGFCGGYDLVVAAEQRVGLEQGMTSWPTGSPMDLNVQMANHDPDAT